MRSKRPRIVLTYKSATLEMDRKAADGLLSIADATVSVGDEGIVECFVAAIGNKDSVGDIIMPGAFNASLKKRKPRVVWGHDWNHPIGKVLEIYEVGPTDPRLPEKMKAAGVGGLFARVQFNLESEKGSQAFINIKFFGFEQEWSVGYKTHDAEFDSKRQANLLKEIELYEVSPVLHGANQLTATISIKSEMQEGDPDDDEVKRGLAMAKAFADQYPDFFVDPEEKVGPGNADAIQDAIGGDVLRGRGPHRGNEDALLRYWRPIMKKPGGFRRCLVILADHPELGPLPNLCAWLHHETTGKWPNEGKHHGKSEETPEEVIADIAVKVGRTINGSNMSKLKQALELLQQVVGSGLPVEVKDTVVVENGDPSVKDALDVINEYHGSLSIVKDGKIEIEVKSERHLAALEKVANRLEFAITKISSEGENE